ncbi:hypothetical protein [Asticcacaulis sp. 201]|uniref:hypothetical protein n=1 Tax=Asticcacaulis sp. 201 TaxID=3028787 RepID=UPI0029160274|nr:hypothetical protein [Asticcacaulis sp. 201]MDV6332349.1 hypothetical protein [Asticcacaulis sp. 201]
MIYTWAILSHVLAVIVCGYAFWRGGSVERYGAAIIAVSWILSTFLQSNAGHGPGSVVVCIDVLTMLILLYYSERTRALWVACCAAFTVLAVLTHVAFYTARQMSLVAYITAAGLFGGYCLLLPLFIRMIVLEWQRFISRRLTGV